MPYLVVMTRTVATLLLLVIGLTACGHGPGRDDEGPAQERREQIVEMIRSGELTDEDGDGWVVLPAELSEATIAREGVRVYTEPALTVFFLTQVFYSPDPYCGYEYTDGAEPLGDPLVSGSNKELEPIDDGWYWLCAS